MHGACAKVKSTTEQHIADIWRRIIELNRLKRALSAAGRAMSRRRDPRGARYSAHARVPGHNEFRGLQTLKVDDAHEHGKQDEAQGHADHPE